MADQSALNQAFAEYARSIALQYEIGEVLYQDARTDDVATRHVREQLQAKGIVPERHGVDPSAAFDMIRSHARSNNETVHEIARAIVERSLKL